MEISIQYLQKSWKETGKKKLIALPYYYHHRDPRRTMRPSERLFMYLYGRCNTAEPKRFVYEWIRPRYHRPVIQKRRWQARPRLAEQIIGEREWVRGGAATSHHPKTAPAESLAHKTLFIFKGDL